MKASPLILSWLSPRQGLRQRAPNRMARLRWVSPLLIIISAILAILPRPALAQGPILTAHQPITNTVAAPLNSSVVLTYSADIDAATVTSQTIAVHSMMRGLITQTHSVNGNVVMVDPTRNFFPGELVYAIATTRTTDINGTHPLTPTQWQFTAGEVTNRCVGGFTNINAGLTGVNGGNVAWGDYDNDGDLDILLTGSTGSGYVSQVWRNNGDGSFTNINAGLTGVDYGGAIWGDTDNDGDLDILLTGSTGSGYVSQVWRNNGNGSFTNINAGLTGVYLSSVAWGDYDNDGDLDILLTGWDGNDIPIAEIYRNDNGTFTDIGAGLTGVRYSSVAWGDYDNDGDLDILLTGWADNHITIAEIYRNDNGAFTDINAGLTGVVASSVAWGDYDNDGDLDILLTGWDGNYIPYIHIAKIYRNDNGAFTDINARLTGVYLSSVAWGDYDNDGDLDILLTGQSSSGGEVSQVWRNNGDDTFTDINAGLPSVSRGGAAWGDYDNDGRLDILLNGSNGSGYVSQVWRNDDCVPDVTISKSVSPTSAKPGDSITYTLTFSNAGSLLATNVVITDSLPVSVTNVRVISSGVVITPTGTAPNFGWQVADLAPDAGGVITLTGTLTEPLAAGIFTNTATITTTDIDSNPANNSGSAGLPVQNIAPSAVDDPNKSTSEDIPLTISPLTNDSDPNGDNLTVTLVGRPVNGTAVISGATQMVYTPTLNFHGSDVFTYTVSDGALTDTATITVTVNPVNDAPVAVDDSLMVRRDDNGDLSVLATQPVTIPVLLNDSDPADGVTDSSSLTVSAVGAGSQGGTVAINANNLWVDYTPTAAFTGTETFTYTARDSGGLTDTATVTVTVVNGNGSGSTTPGDSTGETIVIPHTGLSGAITVTVQIPVGVATDKLTLVYNELDNISEPPQGFVSTGLNFTLDAYLDHILQASYVFTPPLTMTIEYSDADVVNIPQGEKSLALFYWAGSEWRSDGITLVTRDTVNNRLTVSIKHLTEFALFGKDFIPTYLPIIVKEYTTAPDLVITELRASGSSITVTLKNQGNTAVTDSFWVDVYFNPDQPPGLNQPWDSLAPAGATWGVTGGIPADGLLTLTVGDTYYVPQYSSASFPVGVPVYGYVDSVNYDTGFGAVRESDEGNNRIGPVVSATDNETVTVGSRDDEPISAGLPGR